MFKMIDKKGKQARDLGCSCSVRMEEGKGADGRLRKVIKGIKMRLEEKVEDGWNFGHEFREKKRKSRCHPIRTENH